MDIFPREEKTSESTNATNSISESIEANEMCFYNSNTIVETHCSTEETEAEAEINYIAEETEADMIKYAELFPNLMELIEANKQYDERCNNESISVLELEKFRYVNTFEVSKYKNRFDLKRIVTLHRRVINIKKTDVLDPDKTEIVVSMLDVRHCKSKNLTYVRLKTEENAEFMNFHKEAGEIHKIIIPKIQAIFGLTFTDNDISSRIKDAVSIRTCNYEPINELITSLSSDRRYFDYMINYFNNDVEYTEEDRHLSITNFVRMICSWYENIMFGMNMTTTKSDSIFIIQSDKQGIGKTTFINSFQIFEDQPMLKSDYSFTSLRGDEAVHLWDNYVISLDEFELNSTNIRKLKELSSKTTFDHRVSYTQHKRDDKTTAMFIITTNDRTYTADPTGMRRFLISRPAGFLQTNNAEKLKNGNPIFGFNSYKMLAAGKYMYDVVTTGTAEEREELASIVGDWVNEGIFHCHYSNEEIKANEAYLNYEKEEIIADYDTYIEVPTEGTPTQWKQQGYKAMNVGEIIMGLKNENKAASYGCIKSDKSMLSNYIKTHRDRILQQYKVKFSINDANNAKYYVRFKSDISEYTLQPTKSHSSRSNRYTFEKLSKSS